MAFIVTEVGLKNKNNSESTKKEDLFISVIFIIDIVVMKNNIHRLRIDYYWIYIRIQRMYSPNLYSLDCVPATEILWVIRIDKRTVEYQYFTVDAEVWNVDVS